MDLELAGVHASGDTIGALLVAATAGVETAGAKTGTTGLRFEVMTGPTGATRTVLAVSGWAQSARRNGVATCDIVLENLSAMLKQKNQEITKWLFKFKK